MATINTSQDTKEEFKEEKLNYSAKIKKDISEDEFLKVLLNNFKEKKR